jgi:hypothetical protein
MIPFLEFNVWEQGAPYQCVYIRTLANLQVMLQFQETSNTETSSVTIRPTAHINAFALIALLLLLLLSVPVALVLL